MYEFENSAKTILVADDEESNRELLSALLTAEGYQVVCANDGDEALSAIRSRRLIWLCWMS